MSYMFRFIAEDSYLACAHADHNGYQHSYNEDCIFFALCMFVCVRLSTRLMFPTKRGLLDNRAAIMQCCYNNT